MSRETELIRQTRIPDGELSFVKPNLVERYRCELTSGYTRQRTRMAGNEKLAQ
jgi:hypothetical protein